LGQAGKRRDLNPRVPLSSPHGNYNKERHNSQSKSTEHTNA
jgi:hypothetical protein